MKKLKYIPGDLVMVDGWCCPCCGYDSSGEELYQYGD